MFGKLFRRAKSTAAPATSEDIQFEVLERFSLAQIVELLKGASDQTSARTMMGISRRLLDIAHFDDAISEDDRNRAANLEGTIWNGMQEPLAGTEFLVSWNQARNQHLEGARTSGVFSLSYRISRLHPADVVPEIVKLQNAHLLANFPREPMEPSRSAVLSELLRSRLRAREAAGFGPIANGVLFCGWLLLTRDPTAWWLFTAEEKRVLLRFLDDYSSARQFLLGLNAIAPGESIPFDPPPEPLRCSEMLFGSCADADIEKMAAERDVEKSKIAGLDTSARDSLRITLFCLRVVIWKKILADTYGERYRDAVLETSADTGWSKQSIDLCSQIEHVYEICATSEQREYSLSNLVVAQLIVDTLDRSRPTAENDRVVQVCAEVLCSELLYFPPYVRFLLRFMVHGEEGAKAKRPEDYVTV
jgi:hypothetical protein